MRTAPQPTSPQTRFDDENLPRYLETVGVLEAAGAVVEKAGEGNINYVRRVRGANGVSVVVKQARPQLERFPEYEVTTERIVFEARYAEVVREVAPDDAKLLPELIHFDAEQRVIVMEDLGDAPSLEAELASLAVSSESMDRLGRYLGEVHRRTRERAEALVPRFDNGDMRALHGEHIFALPYEPNDFPIPDALRTEAEAALDADVRARIATLRARYYGSAEALVHGDVQAGNVLLVDGMPRLLDAEIAHFGDPAFDLGTAIAHVRFRVALAPEERALRSIESGLFDGYQLAGGTRETLARAYGYAGVEMLRRTIGAARPEFLQQLEPARAVFRHGLELLRRDLG